MNAKKLKEMGTKLLSFVKKEEEFSKSKIGAIVIAGLSAGIVILDAVMDLQLIFN